MPQAPQVECLSRIECDSVQVSCLDHVESITTLDLGLPPFALFRGSVHPAARIHGQFSCVPVT